MSDEPASVLAALESWVGALNVSGRGWVSVAQARALAARIDQPGPTDQVHLLSKELRELTEGLTIYGSDDDAADFFAAIQTPVSTEVRDSEES